MYGLSRQSVSALVGALLSAAGMLAVSRGTIAIARGAENQRKDHPRPGKVLELRGHEGPINTIEFSPDGRRVLTASQDKSARIWDAKSGKTLAVLRGHQNLGNPGIRDAILGPVQSATYSPDGRRILTVSRDKGLRFRFFPLRFLGFLPGPAEILQWDADFHLYNWRPISVEAPFTSGAVWDAATGKEEVRLSGDVLQFHLGTFCNDGRWLLTAESSRREHIRISPHTRFIAENLSTEAGPFAVRLYDVAMASPRQAISIPDGPITAARISVDGKQVLTASSEGDRCIRIWDTSSGREVRSFPAPCYRPLVAIGRDFQRLYVLGENTIRQWDVVSGRELGSSRSPVAHAEPESFYPERWRAVLSPNGRWLAAASVDHTVRIWDAASLKFVAEVRGHSGLIHTVAFSPDDRMVVTTSEDTTVRLSLIVTGEERAVLKGHCGSVVHASFSPDGRQIVTASADGTGRIWSVE